MTIKIYILQSYTKFDRVSQWNECNYGEFIRQVLCTVLFIYLNIVTSCIVQRLHHISQFERICVIVKGDLESSLPIESDIRNLFKI